MTNFNTNFRFNPAFTQSEPNLPSQLREKVELPPRRNSDPGPATTARDQSKIQHNVRAGFMHLLNRKSAMEKKLADARPGPLSPDLKDLWQQRIDSARLALQTNRDQFMQDGKPLEKELDKLQAKIHGGELPVGQHRKIEKNLVALMAEHLYTEDLGPKEKEGQKHAPARAQRMLKAATVTNLNSKPWNTIRTSFEHQGIRFNNTMRPAAQMKFGQGKDIFATDYGGMGVSSGTTKSANHATNLWATQLKFTTPDGREITAVNATRHGINAAYGLTGKKERKQRPEAALARSKEVVSAALWQHKPEEVLKAMETGQPIRLKLTSTSLVTPMDFLKQTEGSQMKDQVKAWKTLNAMSKNQGGVQLYMKDAHGTPRPVTVMVEAAALNFGVNEAALTQKLSLGRFRAKLNAGWKAADKVNEPGLKKLLGEELSPASEQGWVADYIRENPNAPNIEMVKELRRQVCEIWENKSHREDKHIVIDKNTGEKVESEIGDPYKMAARITLLAQEIGAAPCFNCKSGKDRTGMLDVELKFLAMMWHLHGRLPEPGEKLSKDDQALYQKILLESGNAEIQKQNTGAPGNKVFKRLSFNNLSLRDRVGDDTIFDRAMGLSKLVKS